MSKDVYLIHYKPDTLKWLKTNPRYYKLHNTVIVGNLLYESDDLLKLGDLCFYNYEVFYIGKKLDERKRTKIFSRAQDKS